MSHNVGHRDRRREFNRPFRRPPSNAHHFTATDIFRALSTKCNFFQARLESHNRAFESLLALTPAREYYGSHIVDGRDPSEQWNRKKQTKEEKKAARKAKLRPENQKSALDILKEREGEMLGKRKREEEGRSAGNEAVEQDDGGDVAAEGSAKRKSKKAKTVGGDDDEEAKRRQKAERRKEKRMKKKEKGALKKSKAEAKTARKQSQDLNEAEVGLRPLKASNAAPQHDGDEDDEADAEPFAHPMDTDMLEVDIDGLEQDVSPPSPSSAPSTPPLDSPAFDVATNHSAASSSSSMSVPSTNAQPNEKQYQEQDLLAALDPQASTAAPVSESKTSPSTDFAQPTSTSTSKVARTSSPKLNLPSIPHETLRARLEARMAALRAARKADGPDGEPLKSRQDYMDERKRKAEQKKANKKAQRAKQKEDEARKREEVLRGSGSPLSRGAGGDVFDPPPPKDRKENYTFSRLAFDGDDASDAKKKGPQDPATALMSAQSRAEKLSHFNPAKKARVEENDMWSSAAFRASGERGAASAREETSLLKRALKRQVKGKNKSEREWKERESGVAKAQEARQKKREGNLAKRREEGKGGTGGKKGGKSGGKPKGKGKPKARAGFEGRFKA